MEHHSRTTIGVGDCLARMRAGDDEARNELLVFAQRRLRVMVRSQLGPTDRIRRWEQSLDVLQEAMIRLERSLDQVDVETPSQFFALAAVQIRRTIIDLSRHHFGPEGRGRHHATVMRPAGQQDTPDPFERFGSYEPSASHDPSPADVHDAIARLPDEHREVFDLLFYAGLPQPAAAELLQTSERTLRRRWRSAREALADALRDEHT